MKPFNKQDKEEFSEKLLRQYNNTLLNYLQSCLEIMAKTKCPYFEIPGLGSIYMDEAYIHRYDIHISEREIIKASADKEDQKNKIEKKGEYDPFKGIIESLNNIENSIGKITEELHKTNEIASIEDEEPSEPSSNTEMHIVKGTTAADILNSADPELPIEDKEPIEDLKPKRDITKEEAVQQVQNQKKPLTPKQIHFVNEAYKKRKEKEQIKQHAQSHINGSDEENI